MLLIPLFYAVCWTPESPDAVVKKGEFLDVREPDAKKEAAPKPAAEAPPPLMVKEGKLERGDSIIEVLKRSGATRREAFNASRAAAGLLDPKNLKPGTLYRLYLDHEGTLRKFECLPKVNERLIVKREKDDFLGRWEVTPLESRLYVLKGTLKSSIIEDIGEMGEGISLAVRYVEAMAWSIDFFRDPRPGDSFALVFEKRFLGDKFVEYGRLLAVFYDGKMAKQEGYLFETERGKGDFYDPEGRSLRKAFLKAPLKFTRISSRYSRRRFHPILKRYRPHLAVDYAAPRGTPVYSVGDGVVAFKGRKGGHGKLVIIRHTTGHRTYYGHLSRYARIRVGQKVSQGKVIGYVGSTGLSTGPHLDYRIKYGGRFLNPLKLKAPAGPPLPERCRPEFEGVMADLRPRLMEASLGSREVSRPSVARLKDPSPES